MRIIAGEMPTFRERSYTYLASEFELDGIEDVLKFVTEGNGVPREAILYVDSDTWGMREYTWIWYEVEL